MCFFAARGYRCISFDRRGHGRSSQHWNGHEIDSYADDLAELTEALGLGPAVHVGHAIGGGEIARYIGRHGAKRVSKAVLIGAVPPVMLKSATNPDGLPASEFDQIRADLLADRSQYFKDLSVRFFSKNRQGSKVSQGLCDALWMQGMMGGLNAELDCVKVFSETDFTEDLIRFNMPTLILHGDDDQIVPVDTSARLLAKLIPNATLKVYSGADHGLCSTRQDQVNADILAFLQAGTA
jgi:non-heme chloroperoxidase